MRARRGISRGEKLRFHHEDVRDDLKVVEAVRKAVGRRIEIMIDANQASVEPGLDILDAPFRRAQFGSCAIRGHAILRAAPQLVHRQAGALADDVPQRDFHKIAGGPTISASRSTAASGSIRVGSWPMK